MTVMDPTAKPTFSIYSTNLQCGQGAALFCRAKGLARSIRIMFAASQL